MATPIGEYILFGVLIIFQHLRDIFYAPFLVKFYIMEYNKLSLLMCVIFNLSLTIL